MKGLKSAFRHRDEDTMFPRYGAQTVHMPFGNVYTSLQTGVVDRARTRQRLPRQQALRGRARAFDDRARSQQQFHLDQRQAVEDLSADQKKWVTARRRGGQDQPAKSLELEHQSADKLKAIGVKIVTDVDKTVSPRSPRVQGPARQGARPHAVKIKDLIGAVNCDRVTGPEASGRPRLRQPATADAHRR
jgi:TRAP-type C4-dicarboxylate transport system substrate-binding protein